MELRCNSSGSTTASSAPLPHPAFTNTAKLPIDTVKRIIAAVSRRPVLWLRNNATKRSDITPIWLEVGQDVNLPADICRIKWGHLRDNFRKVFIRNNLSSESPSSWRFYNDMRFMERAVAENIMRQTRSSSKKQLAHAQASSYWAENNNVVPSSKFAETDATVPICELSDSYDMDINRPSFSDISSFFEDSQPPHSKRVKLELNPGDEESVNGGDELNDDDFDEDAASETAEEERTKRTETVTMPDAGVFTIEVLDDDEESGMPIRKKSKSKEANPIDLPFKYISMDASTNTDTVGPQEDDADRMFLLSLLPFFQKVDERRKLRVRQKLQNVLIEELEFG